MGPSPNVPAPAQPMPAPPPPSSEINFKEYFGVIRRRRSGFLQVLIAVVSVGVLGTLAATPIYQTRAKMKVPIPVPGMSIIGNASPVSSILYQPDTVPTQIEMLQVSDFQIRAREEAGAVDPTIVVAIDNRPDTNIIEVVVEGSKPQQIQALANKFVELHIKQTAEQASAGTTNAIATLKTQVASAKTALQEATNVLLSFQNKYRVTDAGTEKEARVKEVLELQSRFITASQDVLTTQVMLDELRKQLEKEPLTVEQESVRDNAAYDKLQERIQTLRADLQLLKVEFRPSHPSVRAAEKQLAAAEDLLKSEQPTSIVKIRAPNPSLESLRTQIRELQSKLNGYQASLNDARARYNARKGIVDQLGPFETRKSQMIADLDVKQRQYTRLIEALDELKIKQSVTPAGAQEIQKAALPTSPIRPRREVNFLLSVVIAIALATGFAFLQEWLDDRVNSPDDLGRISTLPTLGHVPLIGQDQPRLVSGAGTKSHIAEAYRTLRSSIGFAGIDEPLRRLQVTSATAGEGKTVTSVNLAIAMAMDGKKVILIDADLRRPSVFRLLEVDGTPGLSEVLVGMATLDEALKTTTEENLLVLPAGSVPPNPAELLGSKAFDRVLDELDSRCDVLILDSPPCVPVTDPLIISGRVDGVILVLSVNHTKKAAVRHVQSLLARARARVVGVIFNRVQQSKSGYYYSHYYYYYGGGGYYYGGGYYGESAERGDKARRRKGKQPLASGGDPQSLGDGDDI